ncbi:hypothetical protein [Microbacterium sp. LWH3-1.2]|uniref:hypothetical protein n=1 Tax=Microbacterium sp. LWH3-1.2 TaxID=3135256 RepID=UPI00343CBAD3
MLGTGLILGLGTPDPDATAGLLGLAAVSLVDIALATPVAWAATLGQTQLTIPFGTIFASLTIWSSHRLQLDR